MTYEDWLQSLRVGDKVNVRYWKGEYRLLRVIDVLPDAIKLSDKINYSKIDGARGHFKIVRDPPLKVSKRTGKLLETSAARRKPIKRMRLEKFADYINSKYK